MAATTRRTGVLALVVFSSSALASCFADLRVADGALISCDRDADCPEDYVCVAAVQRCVAASAEKEAPQFVDIALGRTAAGAGVDAAISFGVSEALLQAPLIELSTGSGRFALQQREFDGERFTFVYTPTGGEPEGASSLLGTAIDLAGNAAVDQPLGELVLDFAPPRIESLAPARLATQANTPIDIIADLSEAVGVARLTLDGAPLEPSAGLGTASLTFSATVASDGPVAAALYVEDLAGNPAALSADPLFTVDSVAPLLLASALPSAPLRVGRAIEIVADTDEPLALAIPPLVTLSRGGETDILVPLVLASPGHYVFVRTVSATDADGDWAASLSALSDVAGNVAAPAALGLVTIDKTDPAIVDIDAPAALNPDVAFQVSLLFDAPLASVPTVELVGGSATFVILTLAPTTAVGFDYTFEGITPQSGTVAFYAVKVTATDPAGNQTIANAAIIAIDVLDPILSSLQVIPAVAKPGDSVRVVLSASEELLQPPQPVLSGPGGTLALVATNTAPAFSYEYDCALGVLTAAGTYTFADFDLVDRANNVATVSNSATLTVDDSPPVIDVIGALVASNNVLDPDVAAVGDTVTATFDVNEVLPALPTLLFGGDLMLFVGVSPNPPGETYVYEIDVTSSTPKGPTPVSASAIDEVGNQTTESIGSIRVDKNPAELVVGSVSLSLTPPPGSLLDTVTAATDGTVVRVTFTLSENLSNASPAPAVPHVVGATTGIVFAQVPQPPGTVYVYEATLTGVPLDLVATETVRIDTNPAMLDGAGNASLAIDLTTFSIDADSPDPPNAAPFSNGAARIEHRRVPWGEAGAPIPRFSLWGGFAAVEGSSQVFVFDGPEVASAGRLGWVQAAGNGSFAETPLERVDRAQVFVVAVDAAGNASDDVPGGGLQATPVVDGLWLATLVGKQAGNAIGNPHEARAALAIPLPLRSDPQRTFPADQGGLDALMNIEGTAAGSVLVEGERVFSRVALSEDVPAARSLHAMTYHAARGTLVVYGGRGSDAGCGTSITAACDDLWEWNGRTWDDVTPFGTAPLGRWGHALAYDARRDELVVFGGNDSAGLVDDTWAWNGTGWRDVTTVGPSAREAHAMAYDAERGVVVLFGGDTGSLIMDDLWEWTTWGPPVCADAEEPCWKEITPPSPRPTPRLHPAMTYDPGLDRVVLFGGNAGLGTCDGATAACTDTWLWNGVSWKDVTSNGPTPTATCAGAVTYDENRAAVLLFGGNSGASLCEGSGTGSNALWEFGRWATCTDPLLPCWRSVSTSGPLPAARSKSVLAYDQVHGESLLFGGWADALSTCAAGERMCGDVASLVTDPVGGAPVWRPLGFSDISPPRRSQVAMTYDPNTETSLLYGGLTSAGACGGSNTCGDFYGYDGTQWLALCSQAPCNAVTPGARRDAGLAYDTSRDRAMLFGGYGALLLGDTWEWDGALWSQRCDGVPGSGDNCPNQPAARSGAAMVFDGAPGRNRTLVFGGEGAGGFLDDAWGFDDWGTSHCDLAGDTCWRNVTPVTRPSPRRDAAIAFDSKRDVVVLFGGYEGGTGCVDPDCYKSDLWEWSALTWTQVCTASPCSDLLPPARRGAILAFDAGRERMVLYGGRGSTGIKNDLWEWNASGGGAWVEVTPQAVNPGGVEDHAAVYDSRRNVVVVAGGARGNLPSDQLWELDIRVTTRPALHFDVAFAAAQIPAAEVLAVSFLAHAGGVGYPKTLPGPALPALGARLTIWDAVNGGYRALDGNAADLTNPAPLVFDSITAKGAQRRITGDTIYLTLRPTNGFGTGNTPAAIAVDYVAAEVAYRIGFVNACGDSIIFWGEDCDDGNDVDDGDGCDAQCLRNDVCGNGLVESAYEECEPPNTATCDAACQSLP